MLPQWERLQIPRPIASLRDESRRKSPRMLPNDTPHRKQPLDAEGAT